jgi:hypothetical protein
MPRRKRHVAKETKQFVLNKLLPHEYICSDFPSSFFKGFFSCSACDDWRIRAVHGRRNNKAATHADLVSDRLTCKQIKRGKKLIKIRVLIENRLSARDAAIELAAGEYINVTHASERKANTKAAEIARKDAADAELRAKLAIMKAERQKKCIDEAVVQKAMEMFNRSLFTELQSEQMKNGVLQCTLNIEEWQRIQAEKSLKEARLENRKLSNLLLHYKNRMKSHMEKRSSLNPTNDTIGQEDKSFMMLWFKKIEDAFGIMKGAHGDRKAAKLLEMIGAGLLVNGAGMSVLELLHRYYVCNKFSAWKLVHASDMTPTGSFRTATVSGLSELFDSPDDNSNEPKKQRIFASASKVSRERVALNKYAISRVGLTRRETPYGEMYFLDPERVIRLLL